MRSLWRAPRTDIAAADSPSSRWAPRISHWQRERPAPREHPHRRPSPRQGGRPARPRVLHPLLAHSHEGLNRLRRRGRRRGRAASQTDGSPPHTAKALAARAAHLQRAITRGAARAQIGYADRRPATSRSPRERRRERRFCFSSRGCQAPPWRLVRSAILGPSAESGATDRRPRPAWPPRR